MAELLRIEPSTFRKDEAWFVFDDGRQYLRKIDREPRREVNFPAIRRDTIDPVRGMDGKMYDSLSGLRRTYRADGNPQGEAYLEIGDCEAPTKTYDFDPKRRRDDIRRAIADVKAGRTFPDPVVLED